MRRTRIHRTAAAGPFATALAIMAAGFSVAAAEECPGAAAGALPAGIAVAQWVDDARELDFATKYGSYGKQNPLLKGKLETCGFNLRTAVGSKQLRIRGAATKQGWARGPSPFGFAEGRSVVESEVAAGTGKKVRWSATTTFVRMANPGEDADMGAGLDLKTKMFGGRISTQSSLAWVDRQDGQEAALGFAQRHKVASRLFELGRGKVKAIGQFDRAEPGHAGRLAGGKADRQGMQLGTAIDYVGLRLNVTRETRFDNVSGKSATTNRWDAWRVRAAYDFAKLGFKGIRLGLAWENGSAFLDDGAGYAKQEDRDAFKLKMHFGKSFTGEFSTRTVQKLSSDSGGDTDYAFAFGWKKSAGTLSAKSAVKITHLNRRSEDSKGFKLSLGFEAKSKGRNNLRLKLGANMERRSKAPGAYALSSRVRFRF